MVTEASKLNLDQLRSFLASIYHVEGCLAWAYYVEACLGIVDAQASARELNALLISIAKLMGRIMEIL